ncbi:MAG: hypothetical protein OIF32_04360 [Campylobacterales bacterium]|nr:hypothetical protein [Campylobacterales bacterium]
MSEFQNREKVAIFMKLWEYFNRVDTIGEFEYAISSRLYQQQRYPKEVLDEVVKDFYAVKGVEVTIIEKTDEVIFQKEIVNKLDNIFVEFIAKHTGNIKEGLKSIPKKTNLFYLDGSQTEKIFAYINDKTEDKNRRIELVKGYIRNNLDLKEKDAIFIVNDKLFVRYYLEKEDVTSEKRFEGIPAHEMAKFQEKFPEIDCGVIVGNIAKNMFVKYLSPNKIDNITFHKNLLPFFQKSILSVFKKHIECEELHLPFTNYILRTHINQGLYKIAEYVLEKLAEKEEDYKTFVSFYDGVEFVHGGKKVLKYPIVIDEENYTFNAIYSLVSQVESKKQQLLKKEEENKKAKDVLSEASKKIKTFAKDKEYLENIYREKRLDTEKISKELKNLRKEFQELQVKGKTNSKDPILPVKIEEIKKELKELIDKEEESVALRDKAFKHIDSINIKMIETKDKIDSINTKSLSIIESVVGVKQEYQVLQGKLAKATEALARAMLKTKI